MKFMMMTALMMMAASTSFAATEKTETQPDYQTCTFESGEVGKIRFRGDTKQEAFERTTRACLQARTNYYQVQRGSAPTQERQILFAEDCVNKTYCKR